MFPSTGLLDKAGARPADDASSGKSKASEAAVADARQALAAANSTVDADKRRHSPGCVACDQKLVDKAEQQLAQAQATAGTLLDVTL